MGSADATTVIPEVANGAARAGTASAAPAAAAGSADAAARVATADATTVIPKAKPAPAPKPKAKRRPRPKRGTKAWVRWRDDLIHRGVRWGIQLVFLVLSPSLFSAAFNGVKYLFQQFGTADVVEATSFVQILVALLAYTVLFGRFFCGYACSFGLLGDAVYALFAPVRRALHIPDKLLAPEGQRVLQMVKYGVVVGICGLCFLGTWEGLQGYSPWVAFAGLIAFSTDKIVWVAFAVLGVIAVGMALVERFFCQVLCPMGAVFSLMPVLPLSSFTRKREHCLKRCDRCLKGCPVAIHPDSDEWYGGECIACGRCAEGCPISNVNLLRIDAELRARQEASGDAGASGAGAFAAVAERAAEQDGDAKRAASAKKGPARKGSARPPEPRFRVRGTEVWLVLLKAALLIGVCWVLGMIEFVPKFSDVFPAIVLPWQS